jgi:hypothetical protein
MPTSTEQNNHSPGYKTSEFWLTAIIAIPSILVAAGIIPSTDQGFLAESFSKIAGGIVAAIALWKYIHSRTHLKSYLMENGNGQQNSGPALGPESGQGCGKMTHLPAILLAVLLIPGVASAQSPIQHCTLFGRDYSPYFQQLANQQQQIIQLHQQIIFLLAQRQAAPSLPPAPPPAAAPLSDPETKGMLQQIINQLNQPHQQAAPPPQIIVLGGPPQQNIPLGGPPLQNIPLGGPPQQNIGMGLPPQQQIPLGGPPRQDIPLAQPAPASPAPAPQSIPLSPAPAPSPAPQAPKQSIPLGPPAGPFPSGYQRYTRISYLPESCWQPVPRS